MTTRSLYRCTLIVSLAIVAPFSNATSPCRIQGGCIDEVSGALLGNIEVFEKKCAEADPGLAEHYHTWAKEQFGKEDGEFLRKLRGSAIYTQVVPQIKADADRFDRQELLEVCHKFAPSSHSQESTVR